MRIYLGFDIGGTKCTAVLGVLDADGKMEVRSRDIWLTADGEGPVGNIRRFVASAKRMLAENQADEDAVCGIGIVCGGPLDSRAGIIQSPPNLPGWDDVHIVEMLREEFPSCPRVALENDANADAVAEWRYGAGVGTRNMIFITFGTGCGAGLILDGRLYSGTNGNAGECGHIRIAPYGPVGFGKAGSMEGFCSGAGIAKLGEMRALEVIQMGGKVSWYSAQRPASAKDIAMAAAEGDELALKIYAECGTRLGEALAVLIDILNPEAIVIGSVFQRSESLIRPSMEKALAGEALGCAARVCRVLPAKLGDNLGEFAALAMAQE